MSAILHRLRCSRLAGCVAWRSISSVLLVNVFFDKVLILGEWDGLLLSERLWQPLRPGQGAAQVSEKSLQEKRLGDEDST
ncbi:hypothetical protein E2C01_096315 [Portunus trituberculatus]|uniref:Uncharacterized protein n=1 Tax=Portunus trituberculatus TaxID=210409 RepID=A0A5B7K7X3_PORTR|nr:hypothetical protein [Portunus trituberculatus]